MKVALITLLISLAVSVSLKASADDSEILLPVTSFQVKSENASDKLEDVVKSPERILERFVPRGAKIKQKEVSHNQISFYATKTYLFISKTVYVHGVLDLEGSNKCASKKEIGYLATMDFAGSAGLLTDNIEKLEVLICVQELGKNNLQIAVRPKMIKGNHYNEIVGGVVKSLLTDQVDPLITALRQEIAAR